MTASSSFSLTLHARHSRTKQVCLHYHRRRSPPGSDRLGRSGYGPAPGCSPECSRAKLHRAKIIPTSRSLCAIELESRRSWREGQRMTDAPRSGDEPVPLGQRLLDRPFLLLLAGLVVMFGFYTLWGLYEIWSLPRAALP